MIYLEFNPVCGLCLSIIWSNYQGERFVDGNCNSLSTWVASQSVRNLYEPRKSLHRKLDSKTPKFVSFRFASNKKWNETINDQFTAFFPSSPENYRLKRCISFEEIPKENVWYTLRFLRNKPSWVPTKKNIEPWELHLSLIYFKISFSTSLFFTVFLFDCIRVLLYSC